MSWINFFQTKGLEGLAISSRFSRSAIKITKKATVVLFPILTPCVCMKCMSFDELEARNCLHVRTAKVPVNNLGELENYAHSDLRSDGK